MEKPKPQHVQQLVQETSVDVLEKALGKGVKMLENIKESFENYEGPLQHGDRYATMINNVKQLATRNRTVVGVVGNTGAGKSSVINAVLEEERLLPTNCMRACTAVVTEVSWNDDNDEHKKYRAEVEFIQRADWEKELKILFDDMISAEGDVTKDSRNADTEAGIAWAKIKAVYPQITKETIGNNEPEKLLDDYHVKQVLGQTHHISDSSPFEFYNSLQKYVDSPEKKTEEQKKKGEKKKTAYWALIKVVRLYVKSDALSTGAVIVDLPGVHDSNAARAAVAEGYLRQCTRLWVVAPINRAVDDKAAKKLLGDQFKRQLKYDGTYESVTFICSKTDDINLTEASESVGATEKMGEWWDEIAKLQRRERELRKEACRLKKEREERIKIYDEQDKVIEMWETVLEEAEDGQQVFAPKMKIAKRKRATKHKKPRKRARRDSDSEFVVSDDHSDSESEAFEYEADEADEHVRGDPLTVETIKAKLIECKALKTNARKEKVALGQEIGELKAQLDEVSDKIEELESNIASECIAGRNQYSKGAIQQDFAAGIKELDQENAIEEDEENFNPDEDLRDYDAVARSLPVYCVSSKAYQKMCGRMKKDATPAGFKTKDETEIPQLQAHCKQLTEAGRISKCHGFFNKLHQLFNSLLIWSSQDGTQLQLTDSQRQHESTWLNKKLLNLEEDFDKALTDGIDDLKDNLAKNLFQYYPTAIQEAESAAAPRALTWGKPRAEGGLYWATYKAVCRRHGGPFNGAGGAHDFNKQLTEPIEKLLASRWEQTFQRRFPESLKKITQTLNKMLAQFHEAVGRRMEKRSVTIPMDLLKSQCEVSQKLIDALVDTVLATVTEKQKEANRELVPVITTAMTDGYQRCIDERGPGSFKRMKEAMLDHVSKNKGNMFKKATEGVEEHLRKMRLQIEEQMKNETEQVLQTMRREYFAVIVGTKLPEGYTMPREERKLRQDVGDLIEEADECFRRVLTGDDDVEDTANGDTNKQPTHDYPTDEESVDEEYTDPVAEERYSDVSSEVSMEDAETGVNVEVSDFGGDDPAADTTSVMTQQPTSVKVEVKPEIKAESQEAAMSNGVDTEQQPTSATRPQDPAAPSVDDTAIDNEL